jgi:hypothetical protein
VQETKWLLARTEDQEKRAQLAIYLMREERRFAEENAIVSVYLDGEGNFEERPEDTKTYRRWLAVVEARRRGLSWNDAYIDASRRSKGTGYRGKPGTMKRDYQNVQRVIREAAKVGE